MARGSDSRAAKKELQTEFGDGAGHADVVIERVREAYPPELMAVLLRSPDLVAKDALSADAVAKAAGVKPADLKDFSVRGDDILFVAVDEKDGGRLYKGFVPRKNVK